MSVTRLPRIKKEIQAVRDDKTTNFTIELLNEDQLDHLQAQFPGPVNTPYEGGTFSLDIQLPNGYPFLPPKMKFITPVYHPNVSSQTGAICLDILKDQWSPVLSLKSAIISVQSLLSTPEPNDPQDAEVAGIYLRDINTFNATAKYWTNVYAKAKSDTKEDPPLPPGIDASALNLLMEMGFDRQKCIQALRSANGKQDAALDLLLSQP